MRQPRYLALYWIPSGSAPTNPVGRIMARAYSQKGRMIFLGGDCMTKTEIDEVIDELIKDLEDARELAHQRFKF